MSSESEDDELPPNLPGASDGHLGPPSELNTSNNTKESDDASDSEENDKKQQDNGDVTYSVQDIIKNSNVADAISTLSNLTPQQLETMWTTLGTLGTLQGQNTIVPISSIGNVNVASVNSPNQQLFTMSNFPVIPGFDERQYNIDVTYMYSMPLLGQARREPIEQLAIHEQEESLLCFCFLFFIFLFLIFFFFDIRYIRDQSLTAKHKKI